MVKQSTLNHVALCRKIVQGTFKFAGNSKLQIFGVFDCKSGKRMKLENRVFFESREDAITAGYRPCGHCMKLEYKKWIYSAAQQQGK